jgi:hypothetical protein
MVETYRTQADLDTHFASENDVVATRAFEDEELLAGQIKIVHGTDGAWLVRWIRELSVDQPCSGMNLPVSSLCI